MSTVVQPPKGVTINFEVFTWQEMEQILEASNPYNRGLRAGYVAGIAQAHEQNCFYEDTGEPIKFDIEGNMIDGQHRGRAQVMEKKTVRYLVVRGLDIKAQKFMDRGNPRNLTDILVFEGLFSPSDATKARTLVNAIYKHKLRRVGNSLFVGHGGKAKPSDVLLYNLVLENLDSIKDAIKAARAVPTSLMALQVSMYLYWSLSQVDERAATRMFDVLATGNVPEGLEIIHAARERILVENSKALARKAAGSSHGNVMSPVHTYLVLRAWRAWRDGEKLERFKIPTSFENSNWPFPA
jgi:hypothetical protein